MKKMNPLFFAVAIWIIGGTASIPLGYAAENVAKITAQELKAELDQPELRIIDVRSSRDWDSSLKKIQGAVKETPYTVSGWTEKYAKSDPIVLYCA